MQLRKRKASFTLEAVIIMSSMIFIIFAIIAGFMLIYQNTVIYYVATQAAQDGAVMWEEESHLMWKNSVSGKAPTEGLYHDIGEIFGAGVDEREAAIKKWASDKIKAMVPHFFVGSGAETIDVSYHNYVFYRYVEVTITKEVDIPFKEIARYYSDDLNMRVTARTAVSDPAEYIRNIDYGLELAGEAWDMISDKVQGLFNSKKGG